MILVTGATGQLGRATIEHLLQKTSASNIVAFVRDEQKAQDLKDKGVSIRVGSYDDVNSIEKALKGIDKVLMISGLDANRLEQHSNIVDAAKKAGVNHIIYTGVTMKDVNTSAIKPFMESHFQTEDYIKASDIPYTILRNTLYTDGIPFFAGEKVLETGIYLPSGNGKVAYALRREMAEAAANALTQSGYENKTYNITGREEYSYEDVAKELSQLTGNTVTYTDADETTFPDQLRQFGLPEIVVTIASGFSADIKNGQYEVISNDLEKLLGRKPSDLKTGLKEIFKL